MNIVFPKFDDFNEHSESSINLLVDNIYSILLSQLIKCNNNLELNSDEIKSNLVFSSYMKYVPKHKKEYINLNLYYKFFDHVIDISCVIHYKPNGDVYYAHHSKSHFLNYSHNEVYNSSILDILNINHFKSLNVSCGFEIDLSPDSTSLYKLILKDYIKLDSELQSRLFFVYYFSTSKNLYNSCYHFKSTNNSSSSSYPSKGLNKIEDILVYLKFLKAYYESPDYVSSSAINYYSINFTDRCWIQMLENIFIRHYTNRKEELLNFIDVYDMLTI